MPFFGIEFPPRDESLWVVRNVRPPLVHVGPVAQTVVDMQGLDLIVPMTTPCLTGACATVKQTPVVFTYVYDPIAAGLFLPPPLWVQVNAGPGLFEQRVDDMPQATARVRGALPGRRAALGQGPRFSPDNDQGGLRMIVACGFDHAGVPLRARLLKLIAELGHEVLDLGTDSPEPIDYPVKALEVGRAVASGRAHIMEACLPR